MASEAGRGAQVRLDGDAQAAARGVAAASLEGNRDAKRALELAGAVSDGGTPDGSTRTGAAAEDEVLAPNGEGSGESFSAGDTGAVVRGLQDKLRESVSVTDYGAKGDGSTDDTAAFAAALATGRPVFVPRPATAWVVDNLTVPSGSVIFGQMPLLKAKPQSTTPMFQLGAGTDIEIRGLDMQGNVATNQSIGSASGAVSANGASRLRILNNRIRNWTRHCLGLYGCRDLLVEGNFIDGSYHGGGVMCGSGIQSGARIVVRGNIITNTQWAPISCGDVDGWIVEGNICDGSGLGSGSLLDGQIQDCITGYTGSVMKNITIANNVCLRSGNNGIHVAGSRLIITGNVIENPRLWGILTSSDPNSDPLDMAQCVISGNTIINPGDGIGIILRNQSGVTLTGNTMQGCVYGLVLHGMGTSTIGVSGVSVVSNTFKTCTSYGVWWRGIVKNVVVQGNVFDTCTSIHGFETVNPLDQVIGDNTFINCPSTANNVVPEYAAPGSGLARLKATGTDTNVHLRLAAKGNGVVYLENTNGIQARFGISSTAGATYPYAFGGTYTVEGSNANINVNLQPKGTGGHTFTQLASSVVPTVNNQLAFEATSNTSLTLRYRGSDGVNRSVVLTLT